MMPDVVNFEGYVKGLRVNDRDGELIISVGVPIEFKYRAMPFSDAPGRMWRIRAELVTFDGEGGGGDEPDDDDDEGRGEIVQLQRGNP